MTSCMVFNHHSLPFDSGGKADEALPDFLKLCIQAHNIGFSTILVDESVDKDWFRLELCRRYFWQDWHNKIQAGEDKSYKDRIRAFRSIATRQPFFSMEDIENNVDLFEVSFDGDSSFAALRAAAWHDAPLAGFPTRRPWIESPLTVKIETLDQAGEIISLHLDLFNFFSPESFELNRDSLLEKRNALIRSGKAILDGKERFFPHLTFCGKAPQQLNNWSASQTILDQVKESLTVLNRFCDLWGDEPCQSYSHGVLRKLGLNHKVSGESDRVLTNPRLKREREFWLPQGRKEVFENHVKLNNGFRLHFFPDHQSKKIYVGYIGTHLRLK
ncbi:MAG: hypothetical protein GY737_20360 [Desulfobacteraceae bacterium]|nr:hypothetical protein [Desulfobacteraceae bacterium]